MLVQDVMSRCAVTITPEESAALAARLLTRHNLGALPVCDHRGTLLGIVTDRDIIVRCVAADQNPGRVSVKDIMSPAPETVSPEDSVHTAARRMAASQVRRLPVVREGKVLGVLSLGDLASARRCESEAAQALCEISSRVVRR